MAKNKMPGITIQGDSELGELLKSLPGNLLREAESGMREVGKIVINAAKAKLVPGHGYDTGQLKKSLGVKWIKKLPREDKVVMYLGPRKGFAIQRTKITKDATGRASGIKAGAKHDPVKIAHLVEFGHKTALARPFLRPAIDENRSRFNAIMVQRIRRLLELRAARAAKKAAA